MAPPYMMKASKPAFQPKAGRKVVASRVEKTKSHAKVANPTFFANALTFRPKEAAPADTPADPMMLDSTEPAPTEPTPTEPTPTDQVNGNPPAASATSADRTTDDESEEENELVDKPFKLVDGIPKAGFRFRKEGSRGRSILGRWKTENIVVKALYPDMDIIRKSKAQRVISPVFHEAANMVEAGVIEEYLARFGDLGPGHSSRVWRWFLGKLWLDTKSKWPRRLTMRRFVHFFSALTEARWNEQNFPKKCDGSKPGLLAQNVSLFLNTAEGKGFSWSNGGQVFGGM